MSKPTLMAFEKIAPILVHHYERYLPTAFDESPSILEKMNKIIETLYRMGEITNGLLDKWNEVMEWVMNEGLSDAVRTRLDEMVLDGTLDEIINEHIFGDLNNKINDVLGNVFYNDITYETYRDSTSSTDYVITHIPHRDKQGNLIELKHGYPNDLINSGNGETPRSFSGRHNASAVMNASNWNVSSGLIYGVQIQDGVIKQDIPHPTNYILGIKEDNKLVAYPAGTSAQSILNDGCVQALSGFFPIIQNGQQVDPVIYSGTTQPMEKHPRQVIAQLANNDILFLTCEGRTRTSEGMTYEDVARILLARGAVFAYNLDGGGSSQTVVRGVLANVPIDGGSVERPVRDFLYVKKDSVTNELMRSTNIDLGKLSKRLADVKTGLDNKTSFIHGYIRLMAELDFKLQGIEVWEGDERKTKLYLQEDGISYYDYANADNIFKVASNGDLHTRKGIYGMFLQRPVTLTNANDVSESGLCWIETGASNSPDNTKSWGMLHIQYDANNALQLAMPFHATTGNLMSRRTDPNTAGTWYAWRQI